MNIINVIGNVKYKYYNIIILDLYNIMYYLI